MNSNVADFVSARALDRSSRSSLVTTSIRVDEHLLSEVDFLAKWLGMSRSSFLSGVISNGCADAVLAIKSTQSDAENSQFVRKYARALGLPDAC